MKKTNQSPVGTSYHNCTITATVNELKAILGEPVHSENDGEDKVNFEWNMETNEGDVFTVYDWKEYRKISEDEKINWHIGGKSGGITIQAQAELATALTTPVKETEPEQPYYKGKGEHSVNQLEAICSQYKEYVSFLNSRGNDTTPTSKEGLEDGGFTKGEWDIAENKETHHTEYAIKSNGWHIAKLNPYAPENIHAEANARLIAAAPAMYKALKEEIECLEEWNGNGNYTTRIEKIKAILTRINKD